MLDFLRRDQPSFAAVHFRGTGTPPADAFLRLRDHGYTSPNGGPTTPSGHSAWSIRPTVPRS